MSIYNFLFLCNHNFDSIVLRIQFLVVQKFNQNIMTRSISFNLKHTYQASFVCPFFLLLSKTCPKENVLPIIIVTLFYENKYIPNFIILLSLYIFSSKINNHFLLSFLLCLLFGIWTFSRVYFYVGSSYCDGSSCCCKLSYSCSSLKTKMKIRPTCSLVLAFLLGFLNLYFLKVFLPSLLFFLIVSKALLDLDNREDF